MSDSPESAATPRRRATRRRSSGAPWRRRPRRSRAGRLREPLPDGPSEPAECSRCSTSRLAGDDGHGRAALLRLRDRRRAAGRPWPRTGWRRPGIRTRRSTRRRPPPRALEEVCAATGCSICSALPRGLRGRLCHRRDDGELHRRSRRRATRCCARRLGRRGRRAVRRAADHGRRRRGSAPHAVQGARAARPRAQPRGARAGRRAGPHARRRAAALSAADDRLRAGRQREHRRLRSAAEIARARRARPAPGCTWTARSACGPPPRRRARICVDGRRAGRLLGHRRAQVAERALRQRPRVRARRRRAARRDGDHGRRTCRPSRRAQPVRLHAGAVAPRARRRGLGRAALARPRGRGRAHRAQLPARAPLRRGAARRGLRGPERRRAQPGAGVVRRAGATRSA